MAVRCVYVPVAVGHPKSSVRMLCLTSDLTSQYDISGSWAPTSHEALQRNLWPCWQVRPAAACIVLTTWGAGVQGCQQKRSETKPSAVKIAAAHFYNLPESEVDRSGATTGQRKYNNSLRESGANREPIMTGGCSKCWSAITNGLFLWWLWHAVRDDIRHVGHRKLTFNLPVASHMDSASNAIHSILAAAAAAATTNWLRILQEGNAIWADLAFEQNHDSYNTIQSLQYDYTQTASTWECVQLLTVCYRTTCTIEKAFWVMYLPLQKRRRKDVLWKWILQMPCWPSLQTYAYLKCWGSLHASSVHVDSQVYSMKYWDLQSNSISCQCILPGMAQHLPSSWAHKPHLCVLKPTQPQYKSNLHASTVPTARFVAVTAMIAASTGADVNSMVLP